MKRLLLPLFATCALLPLNSFADADMLTVRGCEGELLLISELMPEATLNAQLNALKSDTVKDAVVKMTVDGVTREAKANAQGVVQFSELSAGEVTICPVNQESFKLAKADLSGLSMAGSTGLTAAAVSGTAIAGAGIIAANDSDNSGASPARSVAQESSSPSQDEQVAQDNDSLDPNFEAPREDREQVAKAPTRKPATCNKITQNARGDTIEGCRTEEEPTPVSPIS